jgi:formylglycine-generating enzyme required for sulfatase activity
MMGSPDSDKDAEANEKPQHQVRITRSFYLGKFEVSQAEYEAVMGPYPGYFRGRPNNPVECVSWLDAVQFCNQLSEREGLKPFYEGKFGQVPDWNGIGYRLPTEAEWEYACRAGTETRFYFDNEGVSPGDFGWSAENSGFRTQPAGRKRPNAFGLYDMHGNVSEWCWDHYDKYYKWPAVDPHGPSHSGDRVYRDGSFDDPLNCSRSAGRFIRGPVLSARQVGFRVARFQSSN